MRRACVLTALALGACGSSDSKGKDVPAPKPPADAVAVVVDSGPPLPEHQAFADLATAITTIVPMHARVVGFGELHARVDRAQVKSALAHFTAALPAFGDRVSDLIVETFIVDPKCGQKAVETTAKVEKEVKRPEATKSEITLLADAARAAKIQPHAMTLGCKDYETLAPKGGAPDPVAMLTITTKELERIVASAIKHRDKQPQRRAWIALYGGALHNDRAPGPGTEEWSYADTVDLLTNGAFYEVDIIVPELAEADSVSQRQPWFPLVAAAKQVLVYKRGDRSFVIILPRS